MLGKICSKCATKKPFSAFYKHKTTKDRLHPNCKDCFSVYYKKRWKIPSVRKRSAENYKKRYSDPQARAKMLLVAKKYRLRLEIKEKIRQRERQQKYVLSRRKYYKRWIEKNREKVRSWQRSFRAKNKKRDRERVKKWKKSPAGIAYLKRYKKTDSYYASRRKIEVMRRAELAKSDRTFIGKEWTNIKKRQNYKCLHCLKRKKLEIDHIIPLSKGGKHIVENIQGLCRSCNASKGNKIL